MCIAEGMGLAPWGALGGGAFKSEEQRKTGEGRSRPPSEAAVKISGVLEKLAKGKGTEITSIALAYVMQKTPYVFPIVGGRKIGHLKGNIEALSLELSEEDIKEIEGAVPFDIGFPMNAFGDRPEALWLMNMAGRFDYVQSSKALPPHKR